jgi:hypothetical protein
VRTLAAAAAAAFVATALVAPARAAGVPVVTDGFTFSGPAGSQALVRLRDPLGPPGRAGQGPPLTLTASSGDVAGLAILGASRYDVAVRALPRFLCGRGDCGPEAYDTDADSNVPHGERLPAGVYRLVLIGAPGARVTATVPPSSSRARPLAVRPVSAGRPETAPTVDTGGVADGLDQQERGTWSRLQTHRRALVGVVHVAGLRYGNAVTYNGSCPGHENAGNAAFTSAGGPVPLGLAWQEAFGTFVTACESTGVERTVTASWMGRVDAAEARQHGLAFYVPLP